MDQAELEIAAKMVGGVAYEGALYVRAKPPSQNSMCAGCAMYYQNCAEFRNKAWETGGLYCGGLIWIKQNSK